MTILISIGLILGAFTISAWLGWNLARRAQSHHIAFDRPHVDFNAMDISEPLARPDTAADVFTKGILALKTLEIDKSPYAPPQPAPRLDMIAANVVIHRQGSGLQRHVSNIPASVQELVQPADAGLEPIRIGVPQTPPDDLTIISAINSARQSELNGLGIFYYWQVAGWTPENVAWLSPRILSPERIMRENWMSQAARLGKMI